MTDDNLAREREQEKAQRALILLDGEDAPGSNAVLRAFVKAATSSGIHVYGSRDGFAGLISDPARIVKLTPASVRGILPKGGSVLGCSSQANPFAYPVTTPDGGMQAADVSEEVKARLLEHEIDTLVLIGGNGTLDTGMRLSKMGISVVGIPKSIDNDLGATDLAIGVDTAVGTAMYAVDALHSTADAHDRVMILEVMGRHAGWIALMSGVAGGADVILIPEIHYDVDRVIDKICTRKHSGNRFTIVVVGEGSKPLGGTVSSINDAHESQRHVGAGLQLARLLEGRIEHEIQVSVLGQLQRGGSPSSFDRLLGTRLGVHAAELCARENTSQVVALRGQDIVVMPLEAAIANHKRVPPDGELVSVARSIGIELGAE